MPSIVGRLGLWRLWRNRFGRRLYGLLQRLGLVVAMMVRYEARAENDGLAADDADASIPVAFDLDTWRADDPAIPETVPGSLEATDVVVGATHEDELVGYCVLSPRAVFVREIGGVVEPDGVYLWDLYVKPAYRGRGLGSALLRRAQTDAIVTKAGTVEALVAADNKPSRRAFRSAGFAPSERLFSIGWGERTYRRRTPLGSAPER